MSMFSEGRRDGVKYVQGLIPGAWDGVAMNSFREMANVAYMRYAESQEEYDQGYRDGVKKEANTVLGPLMEVLIEGRSIVSPIGDGYDWNGHRIYTVNESRTPTPAEIREATTRYQSITISEERSIQLAADNDARVPEHRQTAEHIAAGVAMELNMRDFDAQTEERDMLEDGVFDPGPLYD